MQPTGVSLPGTTNTRLLAEWAVLLLAALALVLFAHRSGLTERVDLRLLDFSSELLLDDASPDILIVQIDDKSLALEDAWPWDRSRHAQLVEQAALKDPKMIVFDILFIEPLSEAGDARLAEAIAAAGNVALPHTFANAENSETGRIPSYPIHAFKDAAATVGHVAVVPDSDGIVRRFSLTEQSDSGEHKHLAKAVLGNLGQDARRFSGQPIVPIRHFDDYPKISAAQVLDGSVARDSIEGKILLIGATAQGLGDRYAVSDSAGRVMNGVGLQANLLDALINDRLIYELPEWIVQASLLAAVILLLLGFWHLPPRQVLFLTVALVVLLLVVAILSVAVFQRWLPVGPALLAIAIAYPLWGWRRLASVSRYLEREARALQVEVGGQREPRDEGFDTIARQVGRLSRLSGKVRSDFAFMRSVLDASPDPMLVFDGTGALQMLNQPAARLFDHPADDTESTFQDLMAVSGAQLDSGKNELSLPDGRIFLLARASLDLETGSEITALRDVTPLKRAEEQRQEMLEFLSHDMRSPQVAIIGLAGSAEKEVAARIAREARKTLKLAEDFVQIARLEQAGIEREDTDLGGLLFEAADRAHALAKSKSVTIDAKLPDDPIFCEIDAFAMARAVDNLLGNAIKFSPEGGKVTLSLDQVSPSLLAIAIDDEGPGLPEERRTDPFVRFGSRDRSGRGGSGLGLAYVAKVVTEHGGKVRAEPLPGKGTRFVIELIYAPDETDSG